MGINFISIEKNLVLEKLSFLCHMSFSKMQKDPWDHEISLFLSVLARIEKLSCAYSSASWTCSRRSKKSSSAFFLATADSFVSTCTQSIDHHKSNKMWAYEGLLIKSFTEYAKLSLSKTIAGTFHILQNMSAAFQSLYMDYKLYFSVLQSNNDIKDNSDIQTLKKIHQ